MNTVNSNNKKIKYLTYKDAVERYEKIKKDYHRYGFTESMADSSHSDAIRIRKRIDRERVNDDGKIYIDDSVIRDLEKIPEEHRKLLKDYTNLFDKANPNRYKLLSRLLYICKEEVGWGNDVHESSILRYEFLVTYNMKIQRLNDTFNIFKSLKYPNRVLDNMFSYEDEGGCIMNVFRILLNESFFYSYLANRKYLFASSEIEKYDKKTKQLLKDFFPNVNTGR